MRKIKHIPGIVSPTTKYHLRERLMLFIKTWERMILREKNVCTIVCIHFKLYRRIDIMIHDFSHIQAAVASGVWGGGEGGGGKGGCCHH